MFLHLLFQVIFVDLVMDVKLCLLLKHQCNLENAPCITSSVITFLESNYYVCGWLEVVSHCEWKYKASPIVGSISSWAPDLTFNVALLVGRLTRHVQNSQDFANKMRTLKLDMLVMPPRCSLFSALGSRGPPKSPLHLPSATGSGIFGRHGLNSKQKKWKLLLTTSSSKIEVPAEDVRDNLLAFLDCAGQKLIQTSTTKCPERTGTRSSILSTSVL